MNSDGQRPCARGPWCGAAAITIEDGQRVVTPAWTYRPFCEPCERHLVGLLEGIPDDPARSFARLYGRLGAAIGDPQQADVRVPAPFGPQTPIREDIDACMRLTAVTLRGWAARTRANARLTEARHAPGTAAGVAEDAQVLALNITVLLSLQPGWMRRTYRTPLSDELAGWLADDEILSVSDHDVTVLTEVDGETAGQELLHLHYLGRRCLLETNPPPEILITPCRKCTYRELRRAWADGERDLYSRCARCNDEMTQIEYDRNVIRWNAYYRAKQRNRPVLGEPAAA